ncbi:Uncharacterized protein DAT39_013053 [Clarias magur]|uniref:Uncharacterized protein n=1 Tax=Clarias magur TaxID=1594786 RepID=A0A8J4X1H0_CLAMG|nr:Uncharacterized protein DAT39_013053 [Clarias magur]
MQPKTACDGRSTQIGFTLTDRERMHNVKLVARGRTIFPLFSPSILRHLCLHCAAICGSRSRLRLGLQSCPYLSKPSSKKAGIGEAPAAK